MVIYGWTDEKLCRMTSWLLKHWLKQLHHRHEMRPRTAGALILLDTSTVACSLHNQQYDSEYLHFFDPVWHSMIIF